MRGSHSFWQEIQENLHTPSPHYFSRSHNIENLNVKRYVSSYQFTVGIPVIKSYFLSAWSVYVHVQKIFIFKFRPKCFPTAYVKVHLFNHLWLFIHKATNGSCLWKLCLGLLATEMTTFLADFLSGEVCREVAVQRGGLLQTPWAGLGVPSSSVPPCCGGPKAMVLALPGQPGSCLPLF